MPLFSPIEMSRLTSCRGLDDRLTWQPDRPIYKKRLQNAGSCTRPGAEAHLCSMTARNKQADRAGIRMESPLLRRNHSNSGRVLVSYRAVLRARAFRPYRDSSLCRTRKNLATKYDFPSLKNLLLNRFPLRNALLQALSPTVKTMGKSRACVRRHL